MELVTRFLRVRVALFLLTATSTLGGCATAHKDQVAEKKRKKPQEIHALTGSYALTDETTVSDNSIIKRGAQFRGTDKNY